MTYQECLREIHSRKAFSTGGPSLSRISRLMGELGNPQDSLRVVHVAGTNGKGSACAMLAGALEANGYRTGLFTSPYLLEFRERIQIDRVPVTEETLIRGFQRVMEQERLLEAQGYEPVNEFELVTAIAFVIFAEEKTDYLVLEVGLGGRTDPTNLIKRPEAAVIMPISLDHTAVLGNTISEIAGEKAGIIKERCPVVLAKQPEEALGVFRKTAEEKHASLFAIDPVAGISCDRTGTRFLCGGQELNVSLLGEHQMENAAAVWKTLEVLGLQNEASRQSLAHVVWKGRLQYVPGSPDMLIDAGHNIAGVETLTAALSQLFPGKKIIAVMAMMKDKDYPVCIPMVARRARLLIGTTVGLPRSLRPGEVQEAAMPYCQTMTADSVEAGIRLAREAAGAEDLILVCGSVYAAGAAVSFAEETS